MEGGGGLTPGTDGLRSAPELHTHTRTHNSRAHTTPSPSRAPPTAGRRVRVGVLRSDISRGTLAARARACSPTPHAQPPRTRQPFAGSPPR